MVLWGFSPCCGTPDSVSLVTIFNMASSTRLPVSTSELSTDTYSSDYETIIETNSPTTTRTSATTDSNNISTISTASSASPTTISANTKQSSDSEADSPGFSSQAKISIGVGVPLGVFAIAGLGFFIAKSMQWKRKAEAAGNFQSNNGDYDTHLVMENMEKDELSLTVAPPPRRHELAVAYMGPFELAPRRMFHGLSWLMKRNVKLHLSSLRNLIPKVQ